MMDIKGLVARLRYAANGAKAVRGESTLSNTLNEAADAIEAQAISQPPEKAPYTDAVHSLADFHRWLKDLQLMPHAGTNDIHWLDPKMVLEKFEAAQALSQPLKNITYQQEALGEFQYQQPTNTSAISQPVGGDTVVVPRTLSRAQLDKLSFAWGYVEQETVDSYAIVVDLLSAVPPAQRLDQDGREAEKAAHNTGAITAQKLSKLPNMSVEYIAMATIQDALRAYKAAQDQREFKAKTNA